MEGYSIRLDFKFQARQIGWLSVLTTMKKEIDSRSLQGCRHGGGAIA